MVNATMTIESGVAGSIFDCRPIRVAFIVIYTVVFCFCVLGNLVVILVVGMNWRARSVTRFCMGHLALTNLCVGIFCVYQNLSTFLAESWNWGQAMCKMYSFTNGLSHTASILILVLVCAQRYMSLVWPIQCGSVLPIQRVRLSLAGVWILSALICSPRFYYVTTFETSSSVESKNDSHHIICAANRQLYDSKIVDLANFTFLFLLPLIIMILLYSRIGSVIWKSVLLEKPAGSGAINVSSPILNSAQVAPSEMKSSRGAAVNSFVSLAIVNDQNCGLQGPASSTRYNNSKRLLFTARDERRGGRVLKSRKSVIRMLIAIVVTFTVCNLPYHLRKICQYYVPKYYYDSLWSQILTPVTFVLMYANCAINPVLYAFMSKSFRVSLWELLIRIRSVGSNSDNNSCSDGGNKAGNKDSF